HNHSVLLGRRPGNDVRIENARWIDEGLETLAAKAAALPPGEWITSIGGFDPNHLVPPPGEPRLPTLDELDQALPEYPVYLQLSFAGPAVTNSAGKAFFEERGIEGGDDGSIAGGFATPKPSARARPALRVLRTFEGEKRG